MTRSRPVVTFAAGLLVGAGGLWCVLQPTWGNESPDSPNRAVSGKLDAADSPARETTPSRRRAAVEIVRPTAPAGASEETPAENPARSVALDPSVGPLGTVQIQLVGPPETLPGTPVSVLLRVDPQTLRASQLPFEADELGQIEFRRPIHDPRPALYWADFGFPTAGSQARPIANGDDRFDMIVPDRGTLLFELVEADSRPLTEEALVEVRVPRARPPADRWHELEVRSGYGRMTAATTALELEVRCTTRSGRTVATVAQGPLPGAPEPQTIRLELPDVGSVRARLLDPAGAPLAVRSFTVSDLPSRRPIDSYLRTTDSAGGIRLRPDRRVRRMGLDLQWLLEVRTEPVPHYAILNLPASALADGGDLGELRTAPAVLLAAGRLRVPGSAERSNRTITCEQKISVPGKDGGPPATSWVTVAETSIATDDTFAIYGFLAEGIDSIRLRTGGITVEVSPGTRDAELTLPGTSEQDR